MSSPRTNPKVVIISLGGTIASTNEGAGDDASGVRPQLSAADIVATVPELERFAEVRAVAFRQVPSGDLSLSDVRELAEAIDEYFATGTTGVVVVQGTDTMEETSFALDLLVHDRRAVVEVEDNGIGIPAGEHERLFQRFFRSSTATEQAIPGTGLGLVISRAIAEAHEGTIDVRSDTGAGACFRVELPLDPDEASA